MKIVCPSCRVPVAAADVDLATGTARCRTCGSAFRFDAAAVPPPSGARRPLSGTPQGITVSAAGDTLTIRQRWFGRSTFVLLFFTLAWNAALAFLYAYAWRRGDVLAMVFPVLHLAAGIILVYGTLASFLNTTTITIDRSWLRVRTGPVPAARAVNLPAGAVKQLFCEKKVSRPGRTPMTRYSLVALMNDGRRTRVIAEVASPDLPLFLEEHAEAWMKIADEPVAGELARY
jgi:hypothetical protein